MDTAALDDLSAGIPPSDDIEKPATPPEKQGPERKPCNLCGKLVTWTQQGKPRQHKCEPKVETVPTEQVAPVVEGTVSAQRPAISPDAVISKYIETRDEIAVIEKECKEKVEALKEFQIKRENFLQGMLQDLGVKKLGASTGTVFVGWKDSATVEDPEKFMEWVHRDWNARKHFLENRVSKAAVKQRHEANQMAPSGVKYVRFKGVKIRRS